LNKWEEFGIAMFAEKRYFCDGFSQIFADCFADFRKIYAKSCFSAEICGIIRENLREINLTYLIVNQNGTRKTIHRRTQRPFFTGAFRIDPHPFGKLGSRSQGRYDQGGGVLAEITP
jgi:hypothetical protein